MKKQQGFTLIELIVVIVILGILAATAMPKFYDLTAEAEAAAVQGVAGGLSSAGAVNYSVRSLRGTGAGVATSGIACSALASDTRFMTGDVSAYSFAGTIGSGAETCTVTRTGGGGTTATAMIPAIN